MNAVVEETGLEPTQPGVVRQTTRQFGAVVAVRQYGEGTPMPRQMGDQPQYPHLTKLLGRDPTVKTGQQEQWDHWNLDWEERKLAQQAQMTSDL